MQPDGAVVGRRRLLLGGAAAAGLAWAAPSVVATPAVAQGSPAGGWFVTATTGGCELDPGLVALGRCADPGFSALVYIQPTRPVFLRIRSYSGTGALVRDTCGPFGPANGLFAVGFYNCDRPVPAGFRTVVQEVASCGGAVLDTREAQAVACTGGGAPAGGDVEPRLLLG